MTRIAGSRYGGLDDVTRDPRLDDLHASLSHSCSSCYSRDVSPTRRLTCRRFVGSLAVVLLCLSLACESAPTPTTPSGTLQVTTPASTLRAGDSTQLAVVAPGAGAPVATVTWASSDASVASVSAGGLVTARRAGRATITASTGAASGQVALRVVPNFAGTWRGPLFRAQPSCAPTSTALVCAAGTSAEVLRAPVTLLLTQTAGTVTGTLVDGLEPQLVVAVEGRVDDIDVLVLDGRSAAPPGTAPAPVRRLTVSAFRASYDPTLGTISGSFVLAADRLNGPGAFVSDYVLQAQFRDLPRR